MPLQSEKLKGWIKQLAGDLDPLWVSGLAFLLVFSGSLLWGSWLRFEGEKYEWAIYLTLGIVFPSLLLLFTIPRIRSHKLPIALISKIGLTAFLLITSLFFLIKRQQYTALALAAVQFALITIFLRRSGERLIFSKALISLLVIATAWTVSASLLWWAPFFEWFFASDGTIETTYRFIITLLALLLVFLNLNDRSPSTESLRSRFLTIPNIVAIALIAIASVRSDQLFNTMSYSHWSVIIGPAEMVRQGGWLLWDVPSQYGFLNILLVALFPVKSVWQSAYILNSVLLFSTGAFVFYVMRLARPGILNYCFALLVTLAAVFLIAGWPPALLGPQVFPSLGPFRFFWCFVLLAILLWDASRNSAGFSPRVALAGSLAFVIGAFWSSESAAYCAAIWLPAHAVIIVKKVRKAEGSFVNRLRAIVLWALLPLAMLLLVFGAINVFYLLRLGHAPDWSAFYEYSFAFTAGFFAIPIDLNGPVWVLFLMFCAVSTVAAYHLRHGLMHKAAALIVGVWGALWAVSSYFVSRSHPNNATVLSPIFCVVIGITLYVLTLERHRDWCASLIKMSFVPILAMLIATTFGNAGFLRLYLSSPELGYVKNIDTHLSTLDPSLLELLQSAQVKPDDAMVYSAVRVKGDESAADGLSHDHGVLLPAWPGDENHPPQSSHKAWLPTTPLVLFAPLPEARRQTYMARFTSRAGLSGWLIQHKKEAPYTSSLWFYDQVTRTHAPTRTFENDQWQVIWFEFKSPAPR